MVTAQKYSDALICHVGGCKSTFLSCSAEERKRRVKRTRPGLTVRAPEDSSAMRNPAHAVVGASERCPPNFKSVFIFTQHRARRRDSPSITTHIKSEEAVLRSAAAVAAVAAALAAVAVATFLSRSKLKGPRSLCAAFAGRPFPTAAVAVCVYRSARRRHPGQNEAERKESEEGASERASERASDSCKRD